MNTVRFQTQALARSTAIKALGMAGIVVVAGVLSAGPALARSGQADVQWAVTVGSPGAALNLPNVVAPRPVVVYPSYAPVQPVVMPQPYPYYRRPVVVRQPYPYYVRPVVVSPRPVVYRPWGWQPHWSQRYGHHHDGYAPNHR